MNSLKNRSIEAVFLSDPSFPDILILDSEYDVTALHICLKDDYSEEMKRLINRKMFSLREEIQDFMKPGQSVLFSLALIETEQLKTHYSLPLKFLTQEKPSFWDQELRAKLRERFNPRYSLITKTRIGVEDPEQGIRKQVRAKFAEEQKTLVDYVTSSVLWIKGPPGSGKSIVLMARARRCAEENPSWKIQVITYNRSLKRYFSDQLGNYENISVATFGEFTRLRKQTFRMYIKDFDGRKIRISREQSERDFENAKADGISQDVDALFIDEVQDFYPGWLKYAINCVRPNKGGSTIAGDPSQSIYIDCDVESALKGFDVHEETLKTSYRSTKPILQLVELLTGQKQELDGVAGGLTPELVYVDNEIDKNALNKAVIEDVIKIMQSGLVTEGDLAILVTRNYLRLAIHNQLRNVLEKTLHYEVRVNAIERGRGETLSLAEDSIKVTTVHNAKGLEFSIVLLLGLDLLKDDELEGDVEKIKELLFVASTRARDKLIIYTTSFPTYLNNLKDSLKNTDGAIIEFREYPEDYEGLVL